MLAENQRGYKNLIKLVSAGYIDGFYYKPRIDFEMLKEHSEGIIALSACIAGEVPKALLRGDYDEAKKIAWVRIIISLKFKTTDSANKRE